MCGVNLGRFGTKEQSGVLRKFSFLRIPFRIVLLLTAKPSIHKKTCVVVLPLRSDRFAKYRGLRVGVFSEMKEACVVGAGKIPKNVSGGIFLFFFLLRNKQ